MRLDGVQIQQVYENMKYENKFLGVILNHKISWKAHIQHIKHVSKADKEQT